MLAVRAVGFMPRVRPGAIEKQIAPGHPVVCLFRAVGFVRSVRPGVIEVQITPRHPAVCLLRAVGFVRSVRPGVIEVQITPGHPTLIALRGENRHHYMPLWVLTTLLSEIAVMLLIVYYFYKNVQASLLEYMLILILASVPMGISSQIPWKDWNGLRSENVDILHVIVCGLPFSCLILYGSSKGLNWAARQQVTGSGARFWLIVYGALAIPAVLWQLPFAGLLMAIVVSNGRELEYIPLWVYLLEVVSWVVLVQSFRNEWSKARQSAAQNTSGT